MPTYNLAVFQNPDTHWTYLLDRVAPSEREALTAAYHLAARIHNGQWRRTNDPAIRIPYIVHPLRVTRILVEEWGRTELPVLVTSLLHDVLEDCQPDLRAFLEKEIVRVEGEEVRRAVEILSKPLLPEPCPPDAKAARDARYFSEVRSAPEWVRLIKCADRVDNLRDALAWGERRFWAKYSSETLGWHLYLARETAPIAEVALFQALVQGEREIRGRVPVWADGYLIDPHAAAMVPEACAYGYGAIGLAVRGDTLLIGLRNARDADVVEILEQATGKNVECVPISDDALHDALEAGLYRTGGENG